MLREQRVPHVFYDLGVYITRFRAMQFSISITGINEAIAMLEAEAKSIRDHNDFLRQVVIPLAKREFDKVFRTRGYGTWKPLSRSTLRGRRKAGYGTAPLIRTGNYYRQSRDLRGLKLRRNILEINSPVEYARYTEFGTRRSPARSVFKLVANELRRELPRRFVQFRNRSRP